MTGPFKEYSVRLHRDALSTAWGFRLQGGKDFKAPLTIQRVFVGSPADGELHRGDVILSIDNYDAANMFHKQAQDIIKQAGGALSMRVKRGSAYEVQSSAPASVPQPVPQFYRGPGLPGAPATAGALAFVPKPPAAVTSPDAPIFGTDYSQKGRFPKTVPQPPGTMLSRVQQSLNAAIWQPGEEEYDPYYEQQSVADLRKGFQPSPQAAPHGQRYSPQDRSPHRPGACQYKGPRPYLREEPAPAYDSLAGPPPEVSQQQAMMDEDDYEQKSISQLKNMFTSRKAAPQDEYDYKSVKERKKVFGVQDKDTAARRRPKSNKPPPPPIVLPTDEGDDSRSHSRPVRPWKMPDADTLGASPRQDFGWSPSKKDPGLGWGPSHPQAQPQRQHRAPPPQQQHYQPPRQQYQVPQIEVPAVPAWAGSLRSGGGVKPWEVAAAAAATHDHAGRPIRRGPRSPVPQHPPSPQHQQQQQQQAQQPRQGPPHPEAGAPIQPHQPRVQNVHYAPGQDPEYQQHSPADHSGTATVAHLQYNTPLGLYSRQNVEEALCGQTAGKPGEGTMQVTGGGPPGKKQFDPSHSAVLRMLQEQEGVPSPRADQSARYVEHNPGQEMQYQGYMDHYKQSPSMHALESNVTGEDVGTSDF